VRHILGGGDVNRVELVDRPTDEGAGGVRDTPTDGELLGAADHDPHAFRVLYDRWAEPLLAFCYRRTCDAEASLDLVAETFAIAYQKRHRYHDRGRSVGAWLYGIAARELATYQRRQRVQLRAYRRLAGTVPPLDDTSLERIEELVDAAHWRAALAEALAQLTTAERDAVRLRVIDQLDYATVAVRLRCSEQAARARVHRGLARLATTLEAT
jgi:RNA polymerase sigma factor (sigma-70 family)